LLDDLTAEWPARELAPLETLFLTSSRYEYLFWEMAWTQSSWPVCRLEGSPTRLSLFPFGATEGSLSLSEINFR